MITGRIEEITEAEMESEVARLRPSPPEVQVILTRKGKENRAVIENLFKEKGLTYRVEER